MDVVSSRGGKLADADVIDVPSVDIGLQVAIFSDPARMDKIVAHVTCGGSLIDLVRLQCVGRPQDAANLYVQTRAWINSSPDRKKAYAEAQRAREEWLFERVLELFRGISEFDLADIMTDSGAYKPMSEWPRAASVCVKSIDVLEQMDSDGNKIGEIKRVVSWDKNKTLEAIGKHLKMFADKGESQTESWASMVEASFSESGDV